MLPQEASIGTSRRTRDGPLLYVDGSSRDNICDSPLSLTTVERLYAPTTTHEKAKSWKFPLFLHSPPLSVVDDGTICQS
jgi:hypothetical protein